MEGRKEGRKGSEGEKKEGNEGRKECRRREE